MKLPRRFVIDLGHHKVSAAAYHVLVNEFASPISSTNTVLSFRPIINRPVFRYSVRRIFCSTFQSNKFFYMTYKRTSSLPLAILFHIDQIFSIFFFAVTWINLYDKRVHHEYNSLMQKELVPFVLILWSVLQTIRLVVGPKANLDEDVPGLSSVLVGTLFVIPILIFNGFMQEIVFQSDFVLTYLALSIVSAEFALSVSVLKARIQITSHQYYVKAKEKKRKQEEEKQQTEADAVFWSRNQALECRERKE